MNNGNGSYTRSLILNIVLASLSLSFLFLFFEFFVFRFVFLASDYPTLETGLEVVKYVPDQKGNYRVRFEIDSRFQINQQGWNSGHYNFTESKDKDRVIILGDSYVEALQVPFNKSFAEVLERGLGSKWEVYRLGISGAPLSHYLWMLKKEALKYKPDIVVVNLVHNDFSESWQAQGGEYSSSFMKYKIGKDSNEIVDLAPTPYQPSQLSFIRTLAWYRFITYRFQVYPSVIFRKLLDREKGQRIANVNIDELKVKRAVNKRVFLHSLRQFKKLSEKFSFRLVMQIDGVRQLIEAQSENSLGEEALWLNQMVMESCESEKVECVNLHTIFEQDYKENQKSFQFGSDAHWNQHAHTLVADSLINVINESFARVQ